MLLVGGKIGAARGRSKKIMLMVTAVLEVGGRPAGQPPLYP